ncbi:MAG: hypothetical protein ABI858_09005 [Pseudoxanthomonas sp.]
MTDPIRPADDLSLRRKRAVRTALVMGGLALLVYVGFILSGVVAAS